MFEKEDFLNTASKFAHANSGCTKVEVGSVIVNKGDKVFAFGANRTIPHTCRSNGCHRIEVYGNNDKTHRGPADCRAIHSEIDAICMAASTGCSTHGATIYVTRYPCEACARAIVAAYIKKVVYGRSQEISPETKAIFSQAGIDVVHQADFIADDAVN